MWEYNEEIMYVWMCQIRKDWDIYQVLYRGSQ
jgi:hypothetical protein